MFILTENNILLDILKSTGREAGVTFETNAEVYDLSSDFFSLFEVKMRPTRQPPGRVCRRGRVVTRGLLSCSLAGVFVPVAQVPNLTRAVRER